MREGVSEASTRRPVSFTFDNSIFLVYNKNITSTVLELYWSWLGLTRYLRVNFFLRLPRRTENLTVICKRQSENFIPI